MPHLPVVIQIDYTPPKARSLLEQIPPLPEVGHAAEVQLLSQKILPGRIIDTEYVDRLVGQDQMIRVAVALDWDQDLVDAVARGEDVALRVIGEVPQPG